MFSSTGPMLMWSISRDRSSRADTILSACPGILGETVFNRTFAPENFTSTSAMADFELATSSLLLPRMLFSMDGDVDEVGDGVAET